MNDTELEALFSAARTDRPEPSAALLARVMADAMAEAEARAAPAPAPRARPTRGGLARILGLIGGWPAMGGLATAGLMGVWIGYAAPGGFDAVTATMLGSGYDVSDMMPGLDAYLTEG
ncbi:dihydroorotate dehydrogenase [Rhodovulum strictum]|uniref:Dihydroorotate dehydrogenase n=1 Tax=Rhodovulum strictum TaxID=58314 RepID=A0A844BEJ1_9RHOB|nr:dihydroorotate dehydrogenase [Rhodovulum strictum]MRH19502.1 dihydroorotate dehydrogenase [Rhodovulum strictum]